MQIFTKELGLINVNEQNRAFLEQKGYIKAQKNTSKDDNLTASNQKTDNTDARRENEQPDGKKLASSSSKRTK